MIKEFRDKVYEALRAEISNKYPVHLFISDDIASGSFPAVAVGRPTIQISDQLPGAWDADLTVYIIGNRNVVRATQENLDVVAWDVVDILDSGKIKTNDIAEARVSTVTPALTQVAGVEYPCYMVSLVGTSIICR